MNLNLSQENYISDFQKTFSLNPIAAIKLLSKIEQKILDTILFLQAKHGYAWPSQLFIANVVGCTRKHVNKTISKLVSLRFIKKNWEAWTTCDYSIGDTLNTNGIIVLLKKYIPALQYFYKKLALKKPAQKKDPNSRTDFGAGGYTKGISISDLSISYSLASLRKECAQAGAGVTGSASSKIDEKKGVEDSEFRKMCDELLRKAEERDGEGVTKRHEADRSESTDLEKVIKATKKGEPMTGEACYYFNKRKLSLRGRVEFSCFSDKVVREAFTAINERVASDIKDPIKWLYAFCKRISSEQQQPIDLALKQRVYNSMGEVSFQDLWEEASASEIALHSRLSSNDKASSYKRATYSNKQEKSPKWEVWKSHSKPDDVEVVKYLTPEKVEANVKVLESNPMTKHIDFRKVFAKERIEGETIRTTERGLKQREVAFKRYNLTVDGIPLTNNGGPEQAEQPKYEPESITIKEKVSGDVDDRERRETFNQEDPGIHREKESGAFRGAARSIRDVMGAGIFW